MPNIQNFAGGDLPAPLQPKGFAPTQMNFGGPLHPPAQQQLSESEILGMILGQGQPQQPQGNQFGGLQQAIFQRGLQNAQQGPTAANPEATNTGIFQGPFQPQGTQGPFQPQGIPANLNLARRGF